MKKLFLLVFLSILPLFAVAQTVPREEDKKNQREKILEQVESYKKEVSSIRGKNFREDFAVGVKSRDELKKFIIQQAEKPEFAEEMAKARKVLLKLGLVKPDLDLKKVMIDMMTEQIAGCYNPEKSELFLMEGQEGASMQDMILAHEIFHALQDQYYHIDSMMEAIRYNDDLGLTIKGIIEGEATLGGLEYILKRTGSSVLNLPFDIGSMLHLEARSSSKANPDSALAKAPEFIQEMLFFPYVTGASFTQNFLTSQGSWKALDRLFENPPMSTEQLMHPEKYLRDKDYPVKIKLPPVAKELEGRWEEVTRNVMGEFQIKIMFAEFMDEKIAAAAAEGWDGDSYALVECEEDKGGSIFYWLSVWDSKEDAKEFYQALALMFGKRFEKKPEMTDSTFCFLVEKSGETACAEFAGNEVMFILGAGETILPNLRKILLKAQQVIMKDGYFESLSKSKSPFEEDEKQKEEEEAPTRDF